MGVSASLGKIDYSLKGNKYKDPHWDLRSGNDLDTSLLPHNTAFKRGDDGLLRLKGEKESKLLRPSLSLDPTPKRDSVGDGPKSTLRPSKNSSAYGRAVPKSGWFPMSFKNGVYDNAVGGLGTPVAIESFGLNSLSFQLGSTTLQGMSWNGGQPVINISQNGTAATTTFHQAENEGHA